MTDDPPPSDSTSDPTPNPRSNTTTGPPPDDADGPDSPCCSGDDADEPASSGDESDSDRSTATDADSSRSAEPDSGRERSDRPSSTDETSTETNVDADTTETSTDDDTLETSTDDAATGDSSLGLEFAAYVLRLVVAGLVVVARVVRLGALIAARYATDATARRESRRWLLLEGDRRIIVGGFVAGIFAIALLLGISDVIGVRESRFVTTMFSTMIAGLFSFIPIVVAVNQLIISRLFGTPDRLSDRIDAVQEFRARVETQTDGDGVSPTDPAPFLARLAGTLGSRADDLASECQTGAGDGDGDGSAAGEPTLGCLGGAGQTDEEVISALESIRRFAARTREHTNHLSSQLTGDMASVFAVVLPTIDNDYAGAANEARRLGRRFDEDLSARAKSLLSELRELFVTADATRQYFTTIYLQRELARLSRLITYSGTAAILLSSLVIMIYSSGYPPVAYEGPLLVLVSFALAIAFSPLAVLFAYVVRISAILRRTSAPGPFTPPGEYHQAAATETATEPDAAEATPDVVETESTVLDGDSSAGDDDD